MRSSRAQSGDWSTSRRLMSCSRRRTATLAEHPRRRRSVGPGSRSRSPARRDTPVVTTPPQLVARPRVTIVQLPRETLNALAVGDLGRAQATSPVAITEWLGGDECRGIWQRRAQQTRDVPADLPWVTGIVRDEDTGLS